jgi:hypothetical protein
VNAQSGTLFLNFTGTGSVHDAAASTALTNILNQTGVDDVYTKTTFRLGEPAPATTSEEVTPGIPPPATSAKSPFLLSPSLSVSGLPDLHIAVSRGDPEIFLFVTFLSLLYGIRISENPRLRSHNS